MIIKQADRGEGKTSYLIRQASKDKESVIVCRDRYNIEHVKRLAHYLKLKINEPITYQDFQRSHPSNSLRLQYRGKRISSFIIDDLEEYLRQIHDIPVTYASINENSIKIIN